MMSTRLCIGSKAYCQRQVEQVHAVRDDGRRSQDLYQQQHDTVGDVWPQWANGMDNPDAHVEEEGADPGHDHEPTVPVHSPLHTALSNVK